MSKNPINKNNTEQYPIEDEVDLIKLIHTVWLQKATVFSVTLLSAVVAATYLIFDTPYYQVQSVLRPVSVKELDALNQTGLYELSPSQALRRVGAALSSYDLRLNFYRVQQELFNVDKSREKNLEQSFESFNKTAFKMLKPDSKKNEELTPYVGIQLTYPDGIEGAVIVNGLVTAAINTERKEITSDLKERIENRLDQLKLKIATARAKYEAEMEVHIARLQEADSLRIVKLQDELEALRKKAKTKRLNRIKRLDEAIAISKALGIKKPSTPSSLNDNDKVFEGNVFRAEVNSRDIPLYFMGSSALEAERQILLERESDDFEEPRIAEIEQELLLLKNNRDVELLKKRENEELFFEGQVGLREEVARLRNIQIDFSDIELVSIDQQAVEPRAPIRPKKSLVVVLGVFLGLFFGVVIALIRNSLQERRGTLS